LATEELKKCSKTSIVLSSFKGKEAPGTINDIAGTNIFPIQNEYINEKK
jgi:hypothetical protein